MSSKLNLAVTGYSLYKNKVQRLKNSNTLVQTDTCLLVKKKFFHNFVVYMVVSNDIINLSVSFFLIPKMSTSTIYLPVCYVFRLDSVTFHEYFWRQFNPYLEYEQFVLFHKYTIS